MIIWRNLVLCFTLTGIVLTGAFLGCTRQIDVMPNPANLTPVNTGTPTGTATPTITLTPNGPTATFTITMTPSVTNTPAPPTNTFTVTLTRTQTSTPTVTMTATANPNMIDDFEDDDANIIAQGGRNGFWYTANDSFSTINPSTFAPTADSSDGSNYVGNVSGTVASGGFAELSASFLNPKAGYTAPGGTTGVIFLIKGTGPGTIWFSISDTYTDAHGSDADGEYVTVTSAWTPVTVYFTNMDTRGYSGGVPTGTHALDTTNMTSINWEITTAGAYNISIDNIQFTSTTPPPTPTPDCHPVDNMEDDDNAIDVVCGRNGYWYCYSDQYTTATTTTPVNLGTTPITVASGDTASSNPITLLSLAQGGVVLNSGTIPTGTTIAWGQTNMIMNNGSVTWLTAANPTFQMSSPGNASSYAANVRGTVGPACGSTDITGAYSECPFGGFGFDFINVTSGPKQPYDLSGYTGVKFDAKVDPGTTTGVVLFEVPTTDTAASSDHFCVNLGSTPDNAYGFTPKVETPTISTSWHTYTIPWTDLTGQAFTGTGTFIPADATGFHWQTTDGGTNYSIWIDNIVLY